MNFGNFRLGEVTWRLVETAAYTFGLVELLVRKGIITPDEIQAVKDQAESKLHTDACESGLTVELGDSPDKYTLSDLPVIDCEARLPLCHAACCRLRFALTEQDIAERVVQWTLSEPYLNRQAADGYCVHCHSEQRTCGVYQQRPAVCRQFDCRLDRRIWLDFEQRIVNPDLVNALGGEMALPVNPAITAD
jgi:hypothetical protein